MEQLELARGPALAFSVAIFIAGLAWRLYCLFRRPARVDHSEPRRRGLAAGGLRAIFRKMLPPRGVKVRGAAMANAYAWHISLALVVFGFAPHIAFIDRYLGISWPALPEPAFYLAAGVTIVGLLIALLRRLTSSAWSCCSCGCRSASWRTRRWSSFPATAPAPISRAKELPYERARFRHAALHHQETGGAA